MRWLSASVALISVNGALAQCVKLKAGYTVHTLVSREKIRVPHEPPCKPARLLHELQRAAASNNEARVLALCANNNVAVGSVLDNLHHFPTVANEATAQVLWALAASDQSDTLIYKLNSTDTAHFLPLIATRIPKGLLYRYALVLKVNAKIIGALPAARIAPSVAGTLLDAAFVLKQQKFTAEQAMLEDAALRLCTGPSLVRAVKKVLLNNRFPAILTAESTIAKLGTVDLAQRLARWMRGAKTNRSVQQEWFQAMVDIGRAPFYPNAATGEYTNLSGQPVPRIMADWLYTKGEIFLAALVCAIFPKTYFKWLLPKDTESVADIVKAMEFTVALAKDAAIRPSLSRNPARIMLMSSNVQIADFQVPPSYAPYMGDVSTWPPL